MEVLTNKSTAREGFDDAFYSSSRCQTLTTGGRVACSSIGTLWREEVAADGVKGEAFCTANESFCFRFKVQCLQCPADITRYTSSEPSLFSSIAVGRLNKEHFQRVHEKYGLVYRHAAQQVKHGSQQQNKHQSWWIGEVNMRHKRFCNHILVRLNSSRHNIPISDLYRLSADPCCPWYDLELQSRAGTEQAVAAPIQSPSTAPHHRMLVLEL